MTRDEVRRWARKHVAAEIRELLFVGWAANVQQWASVGRKKHVARCRAQRAAARRLLRIALKAVEDAS